MVNKFLFFLVLKLICFQYGCDFECNWIYIFPKKFLGSRLLAHKKLTFYFAIVGTVYCYKN